MSQKNDLKQLLDLVQLLGEGDGYNKLLNENLFPMVCAYAYLEEKGIFGTTSKEDFLSQCQQLQILLLELKGFTDKHPEGMKVKK
ncbi:MAG: hypothetical protein KIT80_16130 [Chitinophagaceae bacterium]|nr:hypothetical protein [Chitinophagaceae bacterium]MCW5928445.1 hypothetical protein [Chitinophagaceae bacterium]